MVSINLQHNLKRMRCDASEIQWGRFSFKVIFPLASCSVVKKSSPMKNMRARSCRKRKYSLGNDIVSNWRRPVSCIPSDFKVM